MKLLCLLLLLSTAQAQEIVMTPGASLNYLTPEVVKKVEDYGLEHFPEADSKLTPELLRKSWDAVKIQVVPWVFKCYVGACVGLTVGKRVTIAMWGKCGYDSALLHELLHVALYSAYGDSDREHKGPLWAIIEAQHKDLPCP